MLYFVRHGQTDWNLERKIQGQTDIELNQTGINQAKEVAEKLKNVSFDKVFCSPLKRTLKTAQIITDCEIEIDNRIIERCNGQFEGKKVADLKDVPEYHDPNSDAYGLEPIPKLNARVHSFLKEILEKYPKQNILIVTHGGVCISVRCFFEGNPKDDNIDNYVLKNGNYLTYEN